jgi:hypothetical protein
MTIPKLQTSGFDLPSNYEANSMDDRRAFLKGTTVDPRQPHSETPPPLSHLPGFVGAAASQPGAQEQEVFLGPRCDVPRPSIFQNASHSGLPLAQQSPPAACRPMTHPSDLVARALEILAEEHETWRSRRYVDRAPRSVR